MNKNNNLCFTLVPPFPNGIVGTRHASRLVDLVDRMLALYGEVELNVFKDGEEIASAWEAFDETQVQTRGDIERRIMKTINRALEK